MNRKIRRVAVTMSLLLVMNVGTGFAYNGDEELNFDSQGNIVIDLDTVERLTLEESEAYEDTFDQYLSLLQSGIDLGSMLDDMPIEYEMIINGGEVAFEVSETGTWTEAYYTYSDLWRKQLDYLDPESDGQALTATEEYILQVYIMTFGELPTEGFVDPQDDDYDSDSMSSRDDFYNMKYAPLASLSELNSSIWQLENTLGTIDASLISGVNSLYAGTIATKAVFEETNSNFNVVKKQLNESEAKLIAGQMSQFDYDQEKLDYDIEYLELYSSYRNYENLEMSLKSMLGLSYEDQIVYEDELLLKELPELMDYDYYLEEALANRIEIKNAQIDLDSKEEIYGYLVRGYGRSQSEAIEQAMEVNNAEYALEEAKVNVEINIYEGYNDVLNKIDAYNVTLDNLELTLDQYEQAKVSFEQGLMNETSLEMVDFGYKMSVISKDSAYRDLQLAYMNLQEAITDGPAY